MSTTVPNWVTYPDEDWESITPEEAGLDPNGLEKWVAGLHVRGAIFGGEDHSGDKYGAVLTRGGYLVHSWGDRLYAHHTASVGKALTWAVLGFAVMDGMIDPDEPINRYWTGQGELSHPHKHLTEGHHKTLTWRHLIGKRTESLHWGGFPMEIGNRWAERRHGAGGARRRSGSGGMGQLDGRPLLRLLLARRAGHGWAVQQRGILATGTGLDARMGPRHQGRGAGAAVRPASASPPTGGTGTPAGG